MHWSAMENGELFFKTYTKDKEGAIVVDIGAQDVNGSLKNVCPKHLKYIGVDFVEGKGVDVILDDPYSLPFEDESIDFVVCSSCFEHSEFFWLLFNEILRTLKPDGLLYLNVPSNGMFHRFPVDCWRFYPDSGAALVKWAKHSKNYSPELLESFIGKKHKHGDIWNDFVAVFIKDKQYADKFTGRLVDQVNGYENAIVNNRTGVLNFQEYPEDTKVYKRTLKYFFSKLRSKLSRAMKR